MNDNWKKCILCGDSQDVLKRIPDNSIDFILTDPPYNIGKHSTGNIPLPGRSAMNNDVAQWDWVDFNPEDWADEFIRILKPTGNLFIFTSYNQLGRWYDCLDKKFDTSNFIIWHKTNPAPKIFKAGFLNSCEMIFTCWNKRHTWNFISQKEMHNFIESPICMRPERLSNPKHPAQKPVSILKKMIEIASNEGDIVFDPFMGVGSTGVAALSLGRKFIGVEKERDYFEAAKQRIDEMVKKKNNNIAYCASEDIHHPQSFYEIESFFGKKSDSTLSCGQAATGLPPIIKWAGGKEKELKYILPNLPRFVRYYEPFVGGGSVFTAIIAKEYYINDLSSELIDIYKSIANSEPAFFKYAEAIEKTWYNAKLFFESSSCLLELYGEFRKGYITKDDLVKQMKQFRIDNEQNILHIFSQELQPYAHLLPSEIEINLTRKMSRMHVLEEKKHTLPNEDLDDNIETAIKSAVYMTFRQMYNDKEISQSCPALHCALFFFIRNYSYSGMFRYNDKGEFNVPYGGIGYNNKSMRKKLDYYKSKTLLEHFRNTQIYNLDFEFFLQNAELKDDDFIFLDPPYDSEFSTYAQNEFTREDQKRLATFLLERCPAKWMMIIKNTDFIYQLYNKKGINIGTFDKEYLVSFMNRNDKKVTHLLITNY